MTIYPGMGGDLIAARVSPDVDQKVFGPCVQVLCTLASPQIGLGPLHPPTGERTQMLRQEPLPDTRVDAHMAYAASRDAALATCERLGRQGHWSYNDDLGEYVFDGTVKGAVKGFLEGWLFNEDEAHYCVRCLAEAEKITALSPDVDDEYSFKVSSTCNKGDSHSDARFDPAEGVGALRDLVYGYAWAIVRLYEPDVGATLAHAEAAALISELGDVFDTAPTSSQQHTPALRLLATPGGLGTTIGP